MARATPHNTNDTIGWAQWLLEHLGNDNAVAVATQVHALREIGEREQKILDMAGNGKDEECEIDGNAMVSEGDDNGAYVQAWVWVSFADTELDKAVEEEEEAANAL